MVLLGARERRAVSVGSSRLTLMRSARYPAAASSSSEPGNCFYMNVSVEMVPGTEEQQCLTHFFHGIGRIF